MSDDVNYFLRQIISSFANFIVVGEDKHGRRLTEDTKNELFKRLATPECPVKQLWLTNNLLGPQAMQHLSKIIANPPSQNLTELYLGINKIGDEGITSIAESLVSPHFQLQILHIPANEIGVKGIEALCRSLTINTTLHTLNIDENIFGEEGAKHIGAILPYSSLTSLFISRNKIGDDGFEKICNGFASSSCKLTYIEATDNNIGKKGSIAFARSISSPNCHLQHISLLRNQISEFKEIFKALQNNVSLTRIVAVYDNMPPSDYSEILYSIALNNNTFFSIRPTSMSLIPVRNVVKFCDFNNAICDFREYLQILYKYNNDNIGNKEGIDTQSILPQLHIQIKDHPVFNRKLLSSDITLPVSQFLIDNFDIFDWKLQYLQMFAKHTAFQEIISDLRVAPIMKPKRSKKK